MATNNTTIESLLPTPDIGLLEQTEYRTFDCLIAAGFCVCLLIGLPGNCLALSYFIQTNKRNLSTILYMAACTIDILSSVVHLPVTFNLFNKRNPGLLSNSVFCSVWNTLLFVLQPMSVFVVMLVSLTRAIVIVSPFYRVKKKYVILSMIVALLFYVSWNLQSLIVNGTYKYSYGFGYCLFITYDNIAIADMINYTVCMGVPTLIVFGACVVSIWKLQNGNMTNETQNRKRKSSITIIYFTVIFLLCNFTTFLNSTLFTAAELFYGSYYPGPIYRNSFMFFYSWLLSEIFCTVLNASLNPVLYFYRMREMRAWVKRLVGVTSFVAPVPTD